MIYVLYILFGITLFQDVKYRGVHWSVFPLLLAGAVIIRGGLNEWQEIMYNMGFLFILLSALTLYLSLKQGEIVVITKGWFSWGDILFLMAVTPLFDLRSYMLFFIAGTIVSLMIHLVVNIFRKQGSVPYAGYMSAVAIFFLTFQTQIILITEQF